MKKILCFVLILLFAVINFAFAADWVQIAEKVYLDGYFQFGKKN